MRTRAQAHIDEEDDDREREKGDQRAVEEGVGVVDRVVVEDETDVDRELAPMIGRARVSKSMSFEVLAELITTMAKGIRKMARRRTTRASARTPRLRRLGHSSTSFLLLTDTWMSDTMTRATKRMTAFAWASAMWLAWAVLKMFIARSWLAVDRLVEEAGGRPSLVRVKFMSYCLKR